MYHVGGGTLPATSPFKLFLNYRNNLLMLDKNLAKTYALGLLHGGMSCGEATSKGLKMAQRMVKFRLLLDWISAFVYLITFKTDCYKSVVKAHKEFRDWRQGISASEVAGYLETYGSRAEVRGIYRKWIVLSSVLKGRKVFGSVKTEDFYKF